MKKFLTAMSIVIGLGLATAQQVAPVTKTKAQQTTKTLKATKAEPAKPAAKLKKDGTVDKRYKQNKTLKKDGTPDKRFRENK